jgi:hypothetical protein
MSPWVTPFSFDPLLNVAFLGQCDDETVAHQLDDDGCSSRLHYSSGQIGSTP